MRILMLAHRIPYPPYTGDKVRSYHIARYLAQQHTLTLGFLVDDAVDLSGVEQLREEIGDVVCGRLWKAWSLGKGVTSLLLGGSVTTAYFHSNDFGRQVGRRLVAGEFDVIYGSSSPMARYAERSTLPLVMDFVDVDSDKWTQYASRARCPRSWMYRAEGRRLRAYEARVARRAECCVLATTAEEALLHSFAPWARTAVIGNGIDLGYYSADGNASESPAVIFSGAMDYLPNIDAVGYFSDEILPRVRREIPETVFYIVGLNPAPSVRRLGERPGVVVTGSVPDVRPYYQRASVSVAPLRMARGIQNKVLQAMALGKAVVASSVAARGLEVSNGEHLYVEDEPGAFAARIVALLQSRGDRRAIGSRARRFVERQHSWDSSFGRLEEVLESVKRRVGSVTSA